MNDVVLVLVSAIVSGSLATLITILWQRKSLKYNSKKNVFETLMSTRYNIAGEESVQVLNMINVVFYDNNNVIDAYRDFKLETEKPQNQNPQTLDKYLKLLEQMAKALKLNKIDWETIKKYYMPIALSKKLQEEELLRTTQIQSYKEKGANRKNQQISQEQQMGIQVILKAMENPGTFGELMKFVEKNNKK